MSAKAYARRMLAGDRLQLARGLQAMRCGERWVEVVLHREGCFQTQLSVILPGVTVPVHRHLRCDSVDITLAGSGTADVWPRWPGFALANLDAALGAQLLHVPRGAWHGGTAGPQGACMLSFQQWDGEPDFISADWEAHEAAR
ncbi:MAG: hypothetical protein V4792_16585 [Pseudomonadota bacterium]